VKLDCTFQGHISKGNLHGLLLIKEMNSQANLHINVFDQNSECVHEVTFGPDSSAHWMMSAVSKGQFAFHAKLEEDKLKLITIKLTVDEDEPLVVKEKVILHENGRFIRDVIIFDTFAIVHTNLSVFIVKLNDSLDTFEHELVQELGYCSIGGSEKMWASVKQHTEDSSLLKLVNVANGRSKYFDEKALNDGLDELRCIHLSRDVKIIDDQLANGDSFAIFQVKNYRMMNSDGEMWANGHLDYIDRLRDICLYGHIVVACQLHRDHSRNPGAKGIFAFNVISKEEHDWFQVEKLNPEENDKLRIFPRKKSLRIVYLKDGVVHLKEYRWKKRIFPPLEQLVD